MAGALSRWRFLVGAALRARGARLLLAGAVTLAVTGLLLAVPVIAGGGAGAPSVVLDSSSTTSPDLDGDATTPPAASAGSLAAPTGAAPDAAPTESTLDPAPHEPLSPAPVTSGSAPPETATSAPGSTSSAGATPSPSRSAGTAAGSAAGSKTPAPRTEDQAADDLPARPPTTTEEVLALVDEARTAAGCEPLVVDPALASPAPLPLGRATSPVRGPSAADVVAGWLADPDSSEVIGDCTLATVGVDRTDGDGDTWWTLHLA